MGWIFAGEGVDGVVRRAYSSVLRCYGSNETNC